MARNRTAEAPGYADFSAPSGHRVSAGIDREGAVLRLHPRTIRAIARRHGQGWNLPAIVARQAATEAWVRAWRHAPFRRGANEDVCRAYCAMTSDEFAGVNARQRWANWRTIPKNLDGVLPNRPLALIDLCCGIGDSTAVLAWYAPTGSDILGIEYNADFAVRAAARAYHHDCGRPAAVLFRAQSVLDEFRRPNGERIEDASIDLVNSSGAVGCHFDPAATALLAREVVRVLRPGGIALIDSGTHGTAADDVVRIFGGLGCERVKESRSCALDRYVQVCLRRAI